MFKIIEERQNDLDRLKIWNTNTGEYVSIIPQFGANINELVLNKNDKLHSLIDGNMDNASFAGKGIFKSANLIPFANRIKKGLYTFDGCQYQLPINYKEEGNAAHGLIYDKEFLIKERNITEMEAQITLEYEIDDRMEGYPFSLSVQYEYTLNKATGLRCKIMVSNLGEGNAPFGCGWHPFLKMSKKVDDLKLKISADELILIDDQNIPIGQTKKYKHFEKLNRIGDQSFDHCFKLSSTADLHITELFDEDEDFKIVLWQETGDGKYNYLQLYIPPARKSIAIEPMTSNVNAFNNQQGLIILKNREIFTASYGIELK